MLDSVLFQQNCREKQIDTARWWYWSNWIISPKRDENQEYLKPPPSTVVIELSVWQADSNWKLQLQTLSHYTPEN